MQYRTTFIHCTLLLVVNLFTLITVNAGQRFPTRGQYNLNVKQSQFYSPSSVKSPEYIRDLIETLSSGTLFEYSVTDLLYNGAEEVDVSNVTTLPPVTRPVTNQCLQDFSLMMSDLLAGKLYALSMLDAAGKIPSGILQGNKLWTGRYDQCRDIKAHDTQHNFAGQYCLTYMFAAKPSSIIPEIDLGVCVPDSCNSTEVVRLISSGKLGMILIDYLGVYPAAAFCSTDPEYSGGAIVALIIFSILGLLIVGGTGIGVFRYIRNILLSTDDEDKDVDETLNHTNGRTAADEPPVPETMSDTLKGSIQNENGVDVPDNVQLVTIVSAAPKKPLVIAAELTEKILLCFCAITNGRKILTIQKSGPYQHLAALNGIRVLSMFWVILGHTHVFISSYADNPATAYSILKRFSFQAVANATFSVDSFFVLSGMLVTYFTLNELKKKNGRLNWALYYFHRYWRLTPVYMLIIMMWTTLVPHFTNGPLYFTLTVDIPGQPLSQASLCQKYWWTNLLYINNLYPKYLGEECLGWSWYLANDMQFFIISPLILYFLYRYRAVGYAILGALMVTCYTTLAVESWKHDISPGVTQPNFHNNTDPHASDYIYIKPWARINSYLVGIIAGYALFEMARNKWKMPKWGAALGWCYAIATGIGMVYGLYRTTQGHFQTQAQAVFYQTVSRTLWSSAVAWVAFACAIGKGGPVNSLLGWSAFAPLARLTYCAYLLHPILIFVHYMSSSTPFHYTDYNMVYLFLGNLVLSYAAAYIMSVCAEAPFMALEKLILPSRGSSSPPVKEQRSKQSNC